MNTLRYWAVVPAAGVGKRMGGDIPKQYLPLAGRCVIEHTLERLLAEPRLTAVVVALSTEDAWWPELACANHPRLLRATGGAERCHSVLHGLQQLNGIAAPADWVLVHDAARPCLRSADLQRLLRELTTNPVGGLLGVPVRDTMKRADPDGTVQITVDRTQLWHAHTPQMFRLGLLQTALICAVENGRLVTDEAAAMEQAGYQPRLIEGHADNLKITRPEDLTLAAFYLAQQAAA